MKTSLDPDGDAAKVVLSLVFLSLKQWQKGINRGSFCLFKKTFNLAELAITFLDILDKYNL